jgi:hypothetical protein
VEIICVSEDGKVAEFGKTHLMKLIHRNINIDPLFPDHFHSLGALTEKARPPNLEFLNLGSTSRSFVSELFNEFRLS